MPFFRKRWLIIVITVFLVALVCVVGYLIHEKKEQERIEQERQEQLYLEKTYQLPGSLKPAISKRTLDLGVGGHFTLNIDNVHDISIKINKLFDNFKFSDDTEKAIMTKLNSKTLYAVRSSGTKEDLDEFSFVKKKRKKIKKKLI